MSRRSGPEDWEFEHRIELIKKGRLTPSPRFSPTLSPPTPPLLELTESHSQSQPLLPPLELPAAAVQQQPLSVAPAPTPVPAHVRIYSSKSPLLKKRKGKEPDCCNCACIIV